MAVRTHNASLCQTANMTQYYRGYGLSFSFNQITNSITCIPYNHICSNNNRWPWKEHLICVLNMTKWNNGHICADAMRIQTNCSVLTSQWIPTFDSFPHKFKHKDNSDQEISSTDKIIYNEITKILLFSLFSVLQFNNTFIFSQTKLGGVGNPGPVYEVCEP